MSVVIVTGDGFEHHYVANSLCAAHDVTAILVCEQPPRRTMGKVLKKSPALFVDKSLRNLYLKAIGDQQARAVSMRRVLGPKAEKFDRQDLVERVGRPKAGRLAERVRELAPDVVAVYGTSIVPDSVLHQANVISLNLHTGVSPWYRGTACTYWPLIDGKPEMVGATVHECTSDVDGGQIFFRESAPLYRDDDMHAIFARTVKTGALGYVETAGKALDGTLTGQPQELGEGKEYSGAKLGFRVEWAGRRARARLSKTWPIEPR
jgi:methionyl-tRNA formyltransferase